MQKNLSKNRYWNTYYFPRVPPEVGNDEIIERHGYKPINFHKKRKNEPINNVFRPNLKIGSNELSCIRFSFTNLTYCLKQALKGIKQPHRSEVGVLHFLKASTIKSILNKQDNTVFCSLVVTKLFDNPYHCDIVLNGIYAELNTPLNVNVRWLCDELLSKSLKVIVNKNEPELSNNEIYEKLA